MLRRASLAAGVLLLASCATQQGMRQAVFRRATFDLGCEPTKLEATELSSRVYGVTGCDKKATYLVIGGGVSGYQVLLNSDTKKE